MSDQTPVKTEYSLGFAFSANREHLVVITKNRPKWQAGKWNGVGGHIEAGETALQCVVREFQEETNVTTDERDWKFIATFGGPDFAVNTYCMYSDAIYDAVTMTDEEISVIPVDLNEIRRCGQTNLPWLVGLALDADIDRISFTAEYRPQ